MTRTWNRVLVVGLLLQFAGVPATSVDVSTFAELSAAIASDTTINVLNDITMTNSITLSGVTGLTISGGGSYTLASDRSFTANSGGLFFVDSGADVTFTGVGLHSGSASNRGGCIYASGSTVTVSDGNFTSCSAG